VPCDQLTATADAQKGFHLGVGGGIVNFPDTLLSEVSKSAKYRDELEFVFD